MYVCLHRDSDGDVFVYKFLTIGDAQRFVSDQHTVMYETVGGIDHGEQISGGDEDNTLCIVFKATDLIVETQRVTIREPVALQ